MDNYYTIEILTEDNRPSLIDQIKSLPSNKTEPEPMILSDSFNKDAEKKPKKKKKKKSILLDAVESENYEYDDSITQEIDEETLLDVENILREASEEDEDQAIVREQKKGYKKLKKDENVYKKEFAEELTLLYSLLDETSKFGRDLEKDLASLKGSKTRGISKYTNDLTELILTSKQNKLNILKEITSLKKTMADLKIKADGKSKDKDGNNNPEYLASAYFKNILNHGRGNFINALNNSQSQNDGDDEYDSMIDRIEGIRHTDNSEDEEDRISKYLMERLEGGNPYRSEEGTKYIEYENRGVKLYVKKCIDTGEWEFIALDKNKIQIYDYPLPSKRDAGRMKFSDDGSYATDSKGRIYNVIEYYLPDNQY